jgi:hypothetical protein
MGKLEKRFPIYSRLFNLYPKAYRLQYSEPTLQTLADMLDDADSPTAKAMIWLRTAFDLPYSISKQQLSYVGATLHQEMPPYMKRSSLAGAVLVAPFFAFVLANAVSGQRLYDSLVWSVWALFIWLIVLPSLAIAINTIALLQWLHEQRLRNHTGFWRTLFDFKHNWPVIGVLVIALGIIALVFGHDSVHCLGGNPLQEAANWHSTWRCIQQS